MGQAQTVERDETVQKVDAGVAPPEEKETPLGSVSKRPFVLKKSRGSGGGNLATMLIVFGAIAVLGIGMVAFLSTKGTVRKRLLSQPSKPNLGQSQTAGPGTNLLPNNAVKPSPNAAAEPGTVNAADIERTKSPGTTQALSRGAVEANPSRSSRTLGEIAKFDEPNTTPNAESRWTPPPYGRKNSGNQQAQKKAEDALDAPSLVFTAHQQTAIHSQMLNSVPAVDNLGLAPGYHVAARLESMATTAVHAPVVAVIEYNYERNGEVIIPAGARAVGKIIQADPSGLVNIEFSSLEYPDGSTVPIDAVAANMTLQAIKGSVTGRQRGKNLLVRSLPDAKDAKDQHPGKEQRILLIGMAAIANFSLHGAPPLKSWYPDVEESHRSAGKKQQHGTNDEQRMQIALSFGVSLFNRVQERPLQSLDEALVTGLLVSGPEPGSRFLGRDEFEFAHQSTTVALTA